MITKTARNEKIQKITKFSPSFSFEKSKQKKETAKTKLVRQVKSAAKVVDSGYTSPNHGMSITAVNARKTLRIKRLSFFFLE